MAHFEKIVVLLVIACVTVILVVTLNEEGQGNLQLSMGEEAENRLAAQDLEGMNVPSLPAEASAGQDLAPAEGDRESNPRSRSGRSRTAGFVMVDPETASEGASSRPTVTLQALADEDTRQKSRGNLLLDDSFESPSSVPAQSGLPAGAALKTLEGLRPTFDPTIKKYTWQLGDSWTSLAKRFYGSTESSALLRLFTEGATHMAAGTEVLVPVYDLRTPEKAANGVDAGNTPVATPIPREELSEERGTLYTTVEGDSLWVIAKKVYQDGSKWEAIFEANTDILEKPESVQVGMGLRIP